MANHPQALKRHRQSLKRRARNRHFKTLLKGQVKKLHAAINDGADKETIENLFRTAAGTLDRVAQKGVIKSNTASRRIGRLAKAVARGPVEQVKGRRKKKK